ncbi:sensor histidine kinase [Clostridium swellfunianum]|uniref:sensor histidine kinase n=1 Tax=Clostridium swellfunianum TaxID=1367462 RepID=UPI002030035B|nr:sensor histidine kinase [Clostridium swellfunianum]MCM0650870.1 sensor histidine kinase [Clostridium swellfunianum]
MDTKLKSSKGRYIISAAIFLLLIFLSAGIYSTYPFIKEQARKYEYNIFEKDDFFYNLNRSNYGIYFDTLKNKDNDILKPSEVLISGYGGQYYKSEENLKNFYNEFDRYIYRNQEMLDTDLKNLDYYAVNKDNKMVKERNQAELSQLLADNTESNVYEALNNKYDFYIVIDYNDKGDMSIKRIYGADKLIASSTIKSNENINNFEVKPIKNMIYIYAVPKELKYKDSITNYQTQSRISSYTSAAANIINPALILITIIALIIPYKLTKETIGFNQIAKVPVEIIASISTAAIVVILYGASYSLISSTLEEDIINFAPLIMSGEAAAEIESLINIMFWTTSFAIVFFTIILLKHIWSIGIKKYLGENSLLYKLLRSIWITNRRVYSYLSNIDLKSKEKKRIRLLLGINLIILVVMSSMWFLGIILAIGYTIVLFRIITKHYSDISNKYNKLFEATNRIAEGKLDIYIEEDLGVFNTFKVELQNIQKGFKKAVDEEVKSQKMKTELITNVSHDLKTPLTSIITYVELLKDGNLPEEKRREYLDTLDRKSQRLKDLIEDLFEVSKATSGNISLNIVDVDVVALMKQTLLELDDKILRSSLSIRANYPEEKVILPLDSQRMFRVFENLIINITKYALEGSRVYIDIFNHRDKVEIVFKNMAANEINFNVDEIMERFVRGDKSRNTEGAGLGLAIAKSFVELHGGRLDIIVDGDLFKVIIAFDKKH